jgi:hypothetical protein
MGPGRRRAALALWTAGAQVAGTTPPAASTKVKGSTLVLIAKNNGFDQSALTANDRQFFLVVRNVSGVSQLSYHIVASSGAALASVALKDLPLNGTNPRSGALLNLASGTYIITEADHPTWTCKLTVN